ncbi:hypothetical protein I3843_05G176100 [Carya illinoinensis]|uniref:Uncharacterized protein n=1 Tax=Carya illinoinensis TaxID=32201 RepID=A0A922JMU1_CARIL|nr:hypothetical protein I3842_05G192400 [Carya illinoinensis]KAG7980298.1 hypothetical protein I3843_05G176100 [Carya illinoinensis]
MCWMRMERKNESSRSNLICLMSNHKAWLTTISLAICKAFDLLEMLNKEEEMLSAIKEKQSKVFVHITFLHELYKFRKGTRGSLKLLMIAARELKLGIVMLQLELCIPNLQSLSRATFAQDVLEGRVKASKTHDHKHQPLAFGPLSCVGGSIMSERKRVEIQVSSLLIGCQP